MQGGEKDCSRAYQGTRVGAASSRDRGGGRGGKGGKDGTSTRSTPSAARPPGRGAAPARPLPGTIQAGPGPAGLGPHTLPYLRRPPLCHPSPQPRPVEKKRALGPHALKTSCKFTPTPPAPSTSSPGRGRPMPATAPPAWLHKVAEKPPPGPGLKGGAGGAHKLRGQRRPGHAPDEPGRLDGRRGGWQCGAHGLAPLSSRHPHPATHLSRGPTGSEQRSLGREFRALRAPLAPRSRSPSYEGQSVRRPRPATPATCPKFRCRARELRRPPPPGLLRLRATGEARPRPPCPLQSAPPPLPTSSPRPPPPLSPSPAPGAGAPAVTRHSLPAAPGRGQHPTPAAPPLPAPPLPALPPVCLLQSPLGNVVLPAGRRLC